MGAGIVSRIINKVRHKKEEDTRRETVVEVVRYEQAFTNDDRRYRRKDRRFKTVIRTVGKELVKLE